MDQIKALYSRLKGSRMALTLGISLVLMAVVCLIEPQKGPLYLYKVNLVTLAAWAGYWLDRQFFPYARPDRVDPRYYETAQIRRALIVAATILAMALGM